MILKFITKIEIKWNGGIRGPVFPIPFYFYFGNKQTRFMYGATEIIRDSYWEVIGKYIATPGNDIEIASSVLAFVHTLTKLISYFWDCLCVTEWFERDLYSISRLLKYGEKSCMHDTFEHISTSTKNVLEKLGYDMFL